MPSATLTAEACTPSFLSLMAVTAWASVAPAGRVTVPRTVPSALRISSGQAGSAVLPSLAVRASAVSEAHSPLLMTVCLAASPVTVKVMPLPSTAVLAALAVTEVGVMPETLTLRAALRLLAVSDSAAARTAANVVLTVR